MLLHWRCGFAQSQEAYDTAVNELFSTLDELEDHLSNSRYLCGDRLTLVDICLFTTLIRFDIAYNVLFKCTKKKLYEYHNLHAYMRDIYQVIALLKKCSDLFIIICYVHLWIKRYVFRALDRFLKSQILVIFKKLWMVTIKPFSLSIQGALDQSYLRLQSMKPFAGLTAGNPCHHHQLHQCLSNNELPPSTLLFSYVDSVL